MLKSKIKIHSYWQINRLKIDDLQRVHVFRLKTITKNFTTLIFFPVKAEMLLFSNLTSGGHQGGHGITYFILKFWFFFEIVMTLKNKITNRVSTQCEIWKEQHLRFHWKKINVVALFVDFLSPNEFWRVLGGLNSFLRNNNVNVFFFVVNSITSAK